MPIDSKEKTMRPEEMCVALFGHLASVVKSSVYSVTGSRARNAESLIAEVQSDLAFKILSGGFAGFNSEQVSLKTYLARAAHNAALDILRKRLSTSILIENLERECGDLTTSSNAVPAPHDSILRKEQYEALQEALGRLKEVDPLGYRILKARYVDGLSYSRIAQALDIPNTERLHLRAHRARRRLATILSVSVPDGLVA